MNTSLKHRIRMKEVTIGSWITIGDPSVVEIMLQAGFDWLALDMEHSALSISEAQQLIRVIDLAGKPPLVRVSHNDSVIIKRVMDAGAHGVIIPNVNSREDALAAVQAVRYPPKGTRGVGLARAQGYGACFEDYKNWQDRESIVIVQIEHINAVEQLGAILSVDGVDGFMIGPYDLSASLGVSGELDHPKVLRTIERIREISADFNVVSGIHVITPKPEKVIDKIRDGFRFISFSLDALFLAETSRRNLEAVRGRVAEAFPAISGKGDDGNA